MGLSAVAGYSAFTPMPSASVLAGTKTQAMGLSEQDQVAVIGARPMVLHSAALAAANLASSDAQNPASTGSASSQGSLDTYL